MNLKSKKILAAKTLKVGKKRVGFVRSRLEEIKAAITKRDIQDLHKEGAIQVKQIQGKKKVAQKKRNRSPGNIRKKVKTRKQDYVLLTRKLRAYTRSMKLQGKVSLEEEKTIRKLIRNRKFKSKANLRDHIGGLKK